MGDINLQNYTETGLAIIISIAGCIFWFVIIFPLMSVAWKDIDQSKAKLFLTLNKIKYIFK